MTHQEFEDRVKVNVSESLFEEWNRVYMAAGDNIDKDTFCKAVKASKGNAEIMNVMLALRDQVERFQIKAENYAHDVEMAHQARDNERKEKEIYAASVNKLNDEVNVMLDENTSLAMALIRAGLDGDAISILGHKRVIATKLALDMELNAHDKAFIAQTFGQR